MVNSHLIEFGYELLAVLPYAYNKYLRKELKGTVSGIDTSCFYYFSPKHTEIKDKKRSFHNIHAAKHAGIPNLIIHRHALDWGRWTPPPLKEHYKDKAITFDKPTVCICNRYTTEWGKEPTNFFNLDILRKLFELLTEKYHVVYINVKQEEYQDNESLRNIDDIEMIRNEHFEVSIMEEIYQEYPECTYNELQLRVFAGCDKFITMNGGLGILASYFGGENIIYSKECQELRHDVHSFHKWYHRLGGSTISHVDSYDNLLYLVNRRWVDNIAHKTYFIINTYNKVKTKKHIRDILRVNPYCTIVVYASNVGISRMLSKYRVIVVDAFEKKKKDYVLSPEEIIKYCKTETYDVIDVENKTTNMVMSTIKHEYKQVPSKPAQSRPVIKKEALNDNDYGFTDIIP